MSENLRLTITIVSWNTEELTRNCLKSLLTENVKRIAEVHIVDNNSHDGSVAMIRREFPEVRLFANKENLGFARANNQSWNEAKGEYWLLLNSDTIVKENAIERLLSFADAHPNAGLLTAKLINSDGTHQSCAQREESFFYKLLEFSRLHKLLPAKHRGDLLLGSYFSYDHPQKLGWTWGTALLARRRAVEEAGALSDEFFMYGEDLEWSLRIRRHGWEIWFCPSAEIIHFGGQSSAQVWGDDKKAKIILDNSYQAIKKHRGGIYVKLLHLMNLSMASTEFVFRTVLRQKQSARRYRAETAYHLQKLFGN